MTATTHETDLQQLTQSVATLAEALTRSERRHAQLARIVRWGTLALVALLAVGATLVAGRRGAAYAAQGVDPSDRIATALEGINQSLGMFATLGQAAADAALNGEGMKDRVDGYLKTRGIPETPKNEMAYVFPVAINTSSALQNGGKLITRLGEDSDAWHQFIVDPSPALTGIHAELKVMNLALRSIPAMAGQMDLMNRNMSTMSYSMGSTMGRMGSWLP